MILFIENKIREGIAQCSSRYGKANNKYMGSDYKPNESSSYLMYVDVNSLYGAAMSLHMPTGGFQWISEYEIYNKVDIFNIPQGILNGYICEYGYICEVDLHYSKHLFDLHKDLPRCPRHLVPPSTITDSPKFLATLYDQMYIIHYRYLQQALELGLTIIAKFHRCLQFRQSKWVKKYIKLNTEQRK